MTILGITGPTGAGKSLFSEYLLSQGVSVIDADEVYHSLLLPPSPCLDALRGAFGDEVFLSDGSLNRPALSKIVFRNEEKLTEIGLAVPQVTTLWNKLRKDFPDLPSDIYTVEDAKNAILSYMGGGVE